jgi:hypothetical protein
VTSVLITEEKEHEKESTSSPDAPIQNLPQSDHEVKNVLDNELLDLLVTLMDNSRDELGSVGQK